jgi:hypothetical protein
MKITKTLASPAGTDLLAKVRKMSDDLKKDSQDFVSNQLRLEKEAKEVLKEAKLDKEFKDGINADERWASEQMDQILAEFSQD